MKLYAKLVGDRLGSIKLWDERGHEVPCIRASSFQSRMQEASRITLELVVNGRDVQIVDEPPKRRHVEFDLDDGRTYTAEEVRELLRGVGSSLDDGAVVHVDRGETLETLERALKEAREWLLQDGVDTKRNECRARHLKRVLQGLPVNEGGPSKLTGRRRGPDHRQRRTGSTYGDTE